MKNDDVKGRVSGNEEVNADRTPRREGGEDSVENMRPEDSRADEKVVVNTHGAAFNKNENSSTGGAEEAKV